MKVLNLSCANGHQFEGWFGSEDDYQHQSTQGLVECPLCANKVMTRLPTAPRLNLSGAQAPSAKAARAAREQEAPDAATAITAAATGSTPTEERGMPSPAELQKLWLRAVRHTLDNTVDVGERFAEEARRIHYGETAARGIRGQTSPDEREALRDEGIEVFSLPLPEALKGPLQ